MSRSVCRLRHHRGLVAAGSIAVVLSAVSPTLAAEPQLPDFTYQGRLTEHGAPANGSFDLEFALFDAEGGGNPIGAPIAEADFPVVDGVFTVALDFPAAFAGEQRWLQVSVEGQPLLPRQPVSTVPVAQFALSGALSGPAGGDLVGDYPSPVIRNGAIDSGKLSLWAVTSSHIDSGAVGTAKLANGAVTSLKLADGAVTAAKLANGSVSTGHIATRAVTLAKIAGGRANGNVLFTVNANSCRDIALSVGSAEPGDVVLFSWGPNASIPQNLVVTGHQVNTAGEAVIRACNHGGTSATVSTQSVRVQTFR